MPRHRAPTSRNHAVASVTVAGAALGASILGPVVAPATAFATPPSGPGLAGEHLVDTIDVLADSVSTTRDTDSRHTGRARAHRRPMTSGERQYRNGCRQGYIVDDCERFSARNLLRHGIDPNL